MFANVFEPDVICDSRLKSIFFLQKRNVTMLPLLGNKVTSFELSLWQRLESFPTDIPVTVVWESRIGFGASVPSGTHEGNGGEQTSVAW